MNERSRVHESNYLHPDRINIKAPRKHKSNNLSNKVFHEDKKSSVKSKFQNESEFVINNPKPDCILFSRKDSLGSVQKRDKINLNNTDLVLTNRKISQNQNKKEFTKESSVVYKTEENKLKKSNLSSDCNIFTSGIINLKKQSKELKKKEKNFIYKFKACLCFN